MPARLPGDTIVFDLDGTLVDSAWDLVATLNKVIANEGLPPLPRDHVGHLVGHGALKMLDRAFAHYDKNLDDPTRSRLHGLFLEIYGAHLADETEPFDGVLDVLDNLKAEGWRLGVCTNKYEHLSRQLLDALEMTHYFDAICGSDTFPVRKPDPQHLFGTIDALGGEAKRTIMIGDSETDIKTAQAANVPVIAVTFGYTEHPVSTFNPTATVDHYREIPTEVAAIAATFSP